MIEDGTYIVNSEIQPGLYRVGRYWEREDANQEIIDNDLTNQCPTILQVQPTDAYIKISGGAVPLTLDKPFDPIANACTDGSFLVGLDIQPGRYKVLPDEFGNAYWARLDKNWNIISNDLGSGQLIVVIKQGDFILKISGTLQPA